MVGERLVVGGPGGLAAGDYRRWFRRRRREGVVLPGGWHCSAREAVSWKYSREYLWECERGEKVTENRWDFSKRAKQ